ncbi:DivIVA domain-containing protein [Catellatospora vulcania]|uniref:DivIVA domain-containing protein n=1 Tax=Catellatospora vulcania TaxID=1460450 RepID=UPI0012D44671|nr:hypothetical protein [Catellatospora vulcania]
MARIDVEPTLKADELFAAHLLGYSFDEVDAYVEDTARRMRRLIAEVQRLSAANVLLDEVLAENARLTAELAEVRPHARIGPRVQSIMRLAEQEADELRSTACEVLADARREADAIRRQAQAEADQARRDRELALDHQEHSPPERQVPSADSACAVAGYVIGPVPTAEPAAAPRGEPQDAPNGKRRARGRSARARASDDGTPSQVTPNI